MTLITMLLASAAVQATPPVLWLDPRGAVYVGGQLVKPRITPGAYRIRTAHGYGYSFQGQHGGLLLPDDRALRLTGSMTVATWIYVRGYVSDGPGAQVLFRGDDRNGLDPYTLVIHGNGTINFSVSDDHDMGASASAELPLERWVHIVASFDAETGKIRLFEDGELVGGSTTSKRPFSALDNGWAPGIGIGNVQNDRGPHNQPMNGVLADLRVYDRLVSPEDAGYEPGEYLGSPASPE